MGYIRMSDLGQAMIATGGGGGGGGGGGYATQARQATQATQYRAPSPSSPMVATPASTPTFVPSTPTSAPPTSAPPVATTTGGGGTPGIIGGGYSYGGQRQRRGRIEGEDVYRSSWEKTTTTFTPGYRLQEQLPTYVQGQDDPYDMFAKSSVDEGITVEEEWVDTSGGQQAMPAGPQKVFKIEDDPELNSGAGLGDVAPAEQNRVRGPLRLMATFAASVAGGVVAAAIVARMRKTA